jgi:hypothetical protein
MYSVKPGRGPSIAGGIAGIVAAVFILFWTGGAADAGAPAWFVGFGVVGMLVAIGGALYNFYNAGAKNRVSTFDVTGPGEEPDPVATALGLEEKRPDAGPSAGPFCVHCGAKTPSEGRFCPHCGKAKAP